MTITCGDFTQSILVLTIFKYGYSDDMQIEKETLLRNMVRYMTRMDRHLDLYLSGGSSICVCVPLILCVLEIQRRTCHYLILMFSTECVIFLRRRTNRHLMSKCFTYSQHIPRMQILIYPAPRSKANTEALNNLFYTLIKMMVTKVSSVLTDDTTFWHKQ